MSFANYSDEQHEAGIAAAARIITKIWGKTPERRIEADGEDFEASLGTKLRARQIIAAYESAADATEAN